MLLYKSGYAQMFPFLEEDGLDDLYQPNVSFAGQRPEVLAATVGVFLCPSNPTDNPMDLTKLAPTGLPTRYGVTNFIFCAGANDASHAPFDGKRRKLGGMFWVNQKTRVRDVADGLSKTIAMGEGAGGPDWPVCHGIGCTTPTDNLADVPWAVPSLGSAMLAGLGLYITGPWGCTIERINKRPVTDGFVDITAMTDRRRSLEGGPHSIANFRSDHVGGAQFLFGDGSLRWLDEEIDMAIFRRLSTIDEGVPAAAPE
jgi:hypothetical protein